MNQSAETNVIQRFLTGIQLGDPTHYQNLTIYPVFSGQEAQTDYLPACEALKERRIKVTEISQAGTVPQLKVTNSSDQPVLLLEGEGLVGARQNRVLNTSILLPEQSETLIPVSCTERGRWSHKTVEFDLSAHFMLPKLRKSKTTGVTRRLRRKLESDFSSDQSEVWDGVCYLARECCYRSPTDAMDEVLQAKARELRNQAKGLFPLQPQQHGLLALINSEPAGMDVISQEHAYASYHERLVHSYLMDASLQKTAPSKDLPHQNTESFLAAAAQATHSRYPSVGRGTDYRLENKIVNGLALVNNQEIIHVALFGS